MPVADEEGRWNFYNDTFCTRDYFRDVLAGIEREWKAGGGCRGEIRARARAFASAIPRAPAGNEFACRPHVLPAFFFMPRRGSLMWKTCCENLRATEAYYFRLLIRARRVKARAATNNARAGRGAAGVRYRAFPQFRTINTGPADALIYTYIRPKSVRKCIFLNYDKRVYIIISYIKYFSFNRDSQ